MLHGRLILRAVVVFALWAGTVVVSGCASPELVNCDPGLFARVQGEPWCLYTRRQASMIRCPAQLPAEHDLRWGGKGCARVENDPLPDGLCEAAGECAPSDGGP
ncbi:MAG TPA: hypothetical protein DEF51_12710 [Myxococcales bacterium]|nr:hypothetical protein [Myxococcales bacterium]